MNEEHKIKQLIVSHLQMGQAFLTIDKIIQKVPYHKIGFRPNQLPYSFYELFYHIQYAQKDILEYCRDADYSAPSWPEDYWPEKQTPPKEKAWENFKMEYITTRDEIRKLVLSPGSSLTDQVIGQPNNSSAKHTLIREVLLVIEHSAYHTGQLVLMARLLGVHPQD